MTEICFECSSNCLLSWEGVSAVAAFIAVCLTWRYVYLTHGSLKATQAQLKLAQNQNRLEQTQWYIKMFWDYMVIKPVYTPNVTLYKHLDVLYDDSACIEKLVDGTRRLNKETLKNLMDNPDSPIEQGVFYQSVELLEKICEYDSQNKILLDAELIIIEFADFIRFAAQSIEGSEYENRFQNLIRFYEQYVKSETIKRGKRFFGQFR